MTALARQNLRVKKGSSFADRSKHFSIAEHRPGGGSGVYSWHHLRIVKETGRDPHNSFSMSFHHLAGKAREKRIQQVPWQQRI